MSKKTHTLADFIPDPNVVQNAESFGDAAKARIRNLPDAADLSDAMNMAAKVHSEREEAELRAKSLFRAVAEALNLELKISYNNSGYMRIDLINDGDKASNIEISLDDKNVFVIPKNFSNFTKSMLEANKVSDNFQYGALYNIGRHVDVNVYNRLDLVAGLYIKTFKHDIEVGRLKPPLTAEERTEKKVQELRKPIPLRKKLFPRLFMAS